jgi:hypothetical protein
MRRRAVATTLVSLGLIASCSADSKDATSSADTAVTASEPSTAATQGSAESSSTESSSAPLTTVSLTDYCELAQVALDAELRLDRLMLADPASAFQNAVIAAVAADKAAAVAAPATMKPAWQQLAASTAAYQEFLERFDYDIVRMLDSMTSPKLIAEWGPARRDIESAMLGDCDGYTAEPVFAPAISDVVPSEYDEFVSSSSHFEWVSDAADSTVFTDDFKRCLGRYAYGTLPIGTAVRDVAWNEEQSDDAWSLSFINWRLRVTGTEMLVACGDRQEYWTGGAIEWIVLGEPPALPDNERSICLGRAYVADQGDGLAFQLAASPAVATLPDPDTLASMAERAAAAATSCGLPIEGAEIVDRLSFLHQQWAEIFGASPSAG